MLTNDINCVFEGLLDKGNLFISNYTTAQQISVLKSFNINAVITVTSTFIPSFSQDNIQHLIIPVHDVSEAEIQNYFQKTFQFIERCRKQGNVLIHCMAGISRSATIVIAYLIKKYGYAYETVYSMVKRKRNKINPNPGFIEKLKDYQNKLGVTVTRCKSIDRKTIKKIPFEYESEKSKKNSKDEVSVMISKKSPQKKSPQKKQNIIERIKSLKKQMYSNIIQQEDPEYRSYKNPESKKTKKLFFLDSTKDLQNLTSAELISKKILDFR